MGNCATIIAHGFPHKRSEATADDKYRPITAGAQISSFCRSRFSLDIVFIAKKSST
jgi:hypothetical protein